MKQRVKKIWASKSVAIPLATVLAATIAVVVFSTFYRAGETAVEHPVDAERGRGIGRAAGTGARQSAGSRTADGAATGSIGPGRS